MNMEYVQQQFAELDLEQRIEQVAPYLAGVLAAIMGIALTLTLMLARHWQAQLYNPSGFQEEFRQLKLNKLLALAVVGLVIFSLAGLSPLRMDLLLLGLSLFMFQGLAVAHGLRIILGLKPTWLIALYLPFILLPVHMALLVATLGLIDTWADFRNYFAQKKPN